MNDAIRAMESGIRLLGRTPYCLGYLGFAYARAGRIDESEKLLKELRDLTQKEYVLPSSFALIYLGLGEKVKVSKDLRSKNSVNSRLYLINVWCNKKYY